MAQPWAKGFYNSRLWKAKRKEILNRDMYTCECGARASEVHHMIELTPGNIGDVSITLNNDLLISLCHDCHTRVTKGTVDCDDGYMFDDFGQLVPRVTSPQG